MTRPLRIVSVCRNLPTPLNPAAGIYVQRRIQAMRTQAEVRTLQPVAYFPGVKPLPPWARAHTRQLDQDEVTHAPMFYLPAVFKSLDAMWLARAINTTVRRWHREHPIDCIDAHFGYPEGAGCAHLAQQLGIPLFITVRGFEHERVHVAGVGTRMLTALRQAAGCICVSHSLRRVLEQHGVPTANITVIHNAINAGVFSPGTPEGAQAARARLGLDATTPLIASVGNLVAGKRHHVLIKAFAQLARVVPAHLVIIGGAAFEPRYPQELTRLARELGVAERVRFTGAIAPVQVADWLRAATVFALGTAREGCCNAVLEALAVGVPVVTTPAGDNTHFVHEGVNGLIVPVDAVTGLAAALQQALQRTWDRAAIATRLHAQVGSWEGVGARVLEYMQQQLASVEKNVYSVRQ